MSKSNPLVWSFQEKGSKNYPNIIYYFRLSFLSRERSLIWNLVKCTGFWVANPSCPYTTNFYYTNKYWSQYKHIAFSFEAVLKKNSYWNNAEISEQSITICGWLATIYENGLTAPGPKHQDCRRSDFEIYWETSQRLSTHKNTEIEQILDTTGMIRRLKRKKPADLQ